MSAQPNRQRCREPRGMPGRYARRSAPDDVAAYLDDAAHYPGGACSEVCFPSSEADVADIVKSATTVLPIGVQSSLTGGATPRGGTVVSTARLTDVVSWSGDSVRVQAGCAIATLDVELRSRGLFYPPAPTFDGATVGGTVATNAAGAATFKYGTTRDWVRAMTIVLANGDVMDLERGRVRASDDGLFEIEHTDGTVVLISLPKYAMPDVPKRSAGYFAAPGMDLIDLFIGSEGTLGVVVDVELALVAPRPGWLVGFVQTRDDCAAISLVGALREASRSGRIDVAAIEYLDARCVELLREDGHADRLGFTLDSSSRASVLYQVEVDPEMTRAEAEDGLATALESGTGAFAELITLLKEHDAVATSVHALPGDDARRHALFELREAVPEAVNRRIKQAQRDVDPSISKCAADVIVPFDAFEESLTEYRRTAEARGLDVAIWGHISDGNVHPNLLPTTLGEYEAACEVLLEMGSTAIALGGSPMSEHGVGRNPIKQALLQRLYGDSGIAEMRALKRVLDPASKLAPGVLFQT